MNNLVARFREGFHCDTCKRWTTRFIDEHAVRKHCRKCEMVSRTDLDRTGRSSKKDKAKNKQERESMY